jgi:hypothetical protein
MRPDGRRTVAVLMIVVAGLLLVIAWLVTKLSEAERRTETPPTPAQLQPPFAALVPPNGYTRADMVAGQAVSVTATDVHAELFNMRIGSGVMLESGLALTARHVLTEDFSKPLESTFRVYCYGTYHEATVLFQDKLTDLAGLEVPGCQAQKLNVSKEPLLRTTRLHVAGYHHDDETGNPYWFHVTTWLKPEVQILPEFAEDPELRWRLEVMELNGLPPHMAVNAGFVRGNSGSYVFNDDGELVAMVIGHLRGPEHGIIVSGEAIDDALNRHKVPH